MKTLLAASMIALLPSLDGVGDHEQYHWLEQGAELFPTELIRGIELDWIKDQEKLLNIMYKYLIWLAITLGLLWAAISLSSCTLMEMLRDQDRARTKAIRLFTPKTEN